MEEFRLILPHPFLPPRFQEEARERNMVLVLDQNMTLHLRWEGNRLHEHRPLTPKAAAHLMREVLVRISQYRPEVQAFSRFILRAAEQPFADGRYDPVNKEYKPEPALPKKAEPPVEIEPSVDLVAVLESGTPIASWSTAQIQQLERLLSNPRGGESPMPMGGFDE